ncbi:MAG: homocysteine S-methyltransferase family protein [Rhizobiaceae bacterium]
MTHSQTILPHHAKGKLPTDAGLQIWLIFHRGIELREFTSFEPLGDSQGRELLRVCFRSFVETVREGGYGFVADIVTWRASPEWCAKLGYSLDGLVQINRDQVAFVNELSAGFADGPAIMICRNLGPRGGGYVVGVVMSVAEAHDHHSRRIDLLSGERTDMISVFTITNVPGTKGIVRACSELDVPCVMSFTVETDGSLPTSQASRDTIAEMDAHSLTRPAYFMINGTRPDHFRHVLDADAEWTGRIRGLCANVSRSSHAELDDGDPQELGSLHHELDGWLPDLAFVGGCSGTDHRHGAQIADALG